MKLRIRGNSIRLRLTRGEVDQAGAGKSVRETVNFGPEGKSLGYVLEVREHGPFTASFDGEQIVVSVPMAETSEWAATDRVGLEAESNGLRVLIEKDFACLSPRRGEDETDMFENPSTEACAG